MAGYQVIARKYRPRTFDEVVGQEAVARTLRNAIESDRVAHAYMFCGPRGVGKTSMARILAKALNCLKATAPTPDPCGECDLCVAAAVGEDLDVFEMDAASNRKVDDARNLISNVSFQPARARFKVYIVDEVHMLTTEAFNALLKTLEEPPGHVKFVFATTDPQKVPATILSRCQRFDFRPVPGTAITGLLRKICEAEGVAADEEALVAISRASGGGVRDAESLLEQLRTLGRGAVKLDDLHALLGTVSGERMRALFDAVADGDVGRALEVTAQVLDAGTDPGELLRQCMRHAHDLLIVKLQGATAGGVVADADARQALSAQAERISQATLAYSVTLFSEALKNARLIGEGRLFAETALARLAGHREMRYLDQVVRDLGALEKRIGGGGGGGGTPAPRPAPEPRAGSPERRPTEPHPAQRPDQRMASGGDASGGSSGPVASTPVHEPPHTEPPYTEPGRPTPVAVEPARVASPPVASSATPVVPAPAPVEPPAAPPLAAAPAPEQERRASGISRPVAEAPPAEPPPTEPPPTEPPPTETAASPATAPTPEPAAMTPVVQDAGPVVTSSSNLHQGALLDAGGLRARWGEVRDAARQASSRLMASLQPARIESLDGNTLTLSFPQASAFHRSALDGSDLREAFRDALESVLGRRLEFRTTERADDPAEQEHERKRHERQRDLVRDRLNAAEIEAARSSPLTKLVETELGARIVHVERDA